MKSADDGSIDGSAGQKGDADGKASAIATFDYKFNIGRIAFTRRNQIERILAGKAA